MIDTHAHIYLKEFDQDRKQIIANAKIAGISKILMPAIDSETHTTMLQVEDEFTECVAMMGLHPCSVKKEYEDDLELVKNYLQQRKFIATSLRDAGMEVIYTGLRQTPEMVVNAALQEDVDAIGISILSGAHMTLFPKIINLMKEKNMNDVLLTGGGIIPEDDIQALQKLGVGKLFTPGTPTNEIASYIKEWTSKHRSF